MKTMCPTNDRNWILVAEDDDAVRETMCDILEGEGYRVATAASGAEALGILRSVSARPSVILLDLMMPGMDGWTFREAQMADSRLHAIPVIVMSGDANLDAKAVALRAAGHLKKPMGLAALLDGVAAYACADCCASTLIA
jgi:CheY-like chemotaxis protein